MDWTALAFLAAPWFVVSWYVAGALFALWVGRDLYRVNTPLKPAMKWAWPIIVLFFSVLGLALYFLTARAPGIGRMRSTEEKRRAHHDYERSMARRVNGAVIHCVAGDGLGIMTGMAIARVLGLTFWQEFWFEYAVGFAFGLLIFQLRSMIGMTDSKLMALWMAFRAEFFSMLTVMAGMGAVMAYVTPAVVGAQPKPDTFAFWGFGAFGLLLGYVFTMPMNWMLVTIGWKHGMGAMEDSRQVDTDEARSGVLAAMVALGVVALIVPAWLTAAREGRPVGEPPGGVALEQEGASGAPVKLATLQRGLNESLEAAAHSLHAGHRRAATDALDAAQRAAAVGAAAAPEGPYRHELALVRDVRRALQMGDERGAERRLAGAGSIADADADPSAPLRPAPPPARYRGVPVVNARGVVIGEIAAVDGDLVRIALDGPRDVWGWWDLGDGRFASVAADALLFGPRRTYGKSYVMLPTLAPAPLPAAAVYAGLD